MDLYLIISEFDHRTWNKNIETVEFELTNSDESKKQLLIKRITEIARLITPITKQSFDISSTSDFDLTPPSSPKISEQESFTNQDLYDSALTHIDEESNPVYNAKENQLNELALNQDIIKPTQKCRKCDKDAVAGYYTHEKSKKMYSNIIKCIECQHVFHKNDEKRKNCANVRQNISEKEMAIWRCDHCKESDESFLLKTSKQLLGLFQSKTSNKKESIENIQTEPEEIIKQNSNKTKMLDKINRNSYHVESIDQDVIQSRNELLTPSMIKCGNCKLEIINSKTLTCIICKKTFHKRKDCTKIHGNKKIKEDWKCSNCSILY